METRKFELKVGALLIDVKGGDNSKLASHHNLTDELALYHLATNPKCNKKFAKLPENYEQLVAEYVAAQTPNSGDNGPTAEEMREALQKSVAKAETTLATAHKSLTKAEKGKDDKKIATAQERVEKAEKALADAQQALEDFEVEQGFAEGDGNGDGDNGPTDGEESQK